MSEAPELFDPRVLFGAEVAAVAETDPRVVVVSADSGKSSGFGPFMKVHPDRYVEAGIEEQGATGLAAGLATAGFTPVFCAIAPFVTCRNYEQFRNDVGYMAQNVKIVGRNGGMTYSDLGPTHHSLEDYALTRMIPGVTVLAPQDAGEIQGAVRAMLEFEGPVYMRIGASPVPKVFEPDSFVIGKGRHHRVGNDVTVITTGYESLEAITAAEVLAEHGVSVDLLCLGTVFPLDDGLILESVARTGRVVTIEEHYETGGLGGAVCELLAQKLPVPVDVIGVPHHFVHTGPYKELLASVGLDAASLAARILRFVNR
ncbi:MAG: transketolase family protein [Ancrocorticia sp.]|jgi:transketolase|nr:transketolase family protein [Ancrocorticia sp.]